jgi:hypothetical protein
MVRRVLAASLLIALAATACSASEPRPAPWGARAEAWMAAFTTADPLVSQPFYDDGVLLEMHGLLVEGFRVQGVVAAATESQRLTSSAYSMDLAAPAFLSRDGAVLQTQDDTGVAWVLRLGPSGVERQSWAGSAASARDFLPTLVDEAVFRQVPDLFLRAWAERDADAAASLYAPSATVVDSLAGVRLDGAERIGGAVRGAAELGPSALSGARLTTLPGRDDDAVYVDGWALAGEPWDRVVLVLEAQLADGCTGAVAVVLDLQQGAVVRDERFYRLDAVRQCLPDVDDDGWWSRTAAPPPAPARAEVVAVPGRLRTSVIGGDERTAGLLLWASGRFAAAALPPPAVASTLVVSPDPGWCLTAGHRSSDLVLELCGAGRAVCADRECTSFTTQARLSALHQLGHQWLDRRQPEEQGCPALADRPGRAACVDPPLDHAAERDVDVVVWGLMDERWVSSRLDGLACPDLVGRFHELTGTAPLQRCEGRR